MVIDLKEDKMTTYVYDETSRKNIGSWTYRINPKLDHKAWGAL